MSMTGFAGAALLAMTMQAQGSDSGFVTDQQAATAPCLNGSEEAAADSLSRAEWQKIIACIFQNTAAQMTPQLPKQMDEGISLVAVSSSGPTFNYTYIVDIAASEVTDGGRAGLSSATRKNVCADGSMLTTLEYGGSYFYRWLDRTGTKLHELRIESC